MLVLPKSTVVQYTIVTQQSASQWNIINNISSLPLSHVTQLSQSHVLCVWDTTQSISSEKGKRTALNKTHNAYSLNTKIKEYRYQEWAIKYPRIWNLLHYCSVLYSFIIVCSVIVLQIQSDTSLFFISLSLFVQVSTRILF